MKQAIIVMIYEEESKESVTIHKPSSLVWSTNKVPKIGELHVKEVKYASLSETTRTEPATRSASPVFT